MEPRRQENNLIKDEEPWTKWGRSAGRAAECSEQQRSGIMREIEGVIPQPSVALSLSLHMIRATGPTLVSLPVPALRPS